MELVNQKWKTQYILERENEAEEAIAQEEETPKLCSVV